MRIRDWSSDVCSSDLQTQLLREAEEARFAALEDARRREEAARAKALGEEKARAAEAREEKTPVPEPAPEPEAPAAAAEEPAKRAEERRGGKECVSTGRTRWSPDPGINKTRGVELA